MQSISKIARLALKRKYLLRFDYQIQFVQQQRTANAVATLAAGYQPSQVETSDKLQRKQSSSNSADVPQRGSFRMLLPPPNVTGSLHLGHALMATIGDVICRQRRQLGFDVDWVPGTDHAGIATQVVVEKKLQKERGLSRQQMDRTTFQQEVWLWRDEKYVGIVEDLKKLGCTLNWEHEYFTLDARRVYAVNVAFIKLFEEGLIRRQNSLVNWSCALRSAISDIEVDTLELKGPTELAVPGHQKNQIFGRIYDISYGVCETNDEIIVSTTRPETLLGDVAVAVHPEDERYSKYRDIGEVKLWHPFRSDQIPLIYDLDVKREFGSGAVKITPAHDRNDFALAKRHGLESIQVFAEDGTISKDFDNFRGLPRFEAREYILQRLSELGLLRAVRDHNMLLPICSRSKDVLEYMLRPQWFLHSQPLAEAAASEVRSGRLRIVPPNFETEWFRWLDDCHDWCISRQLWWGQQIPAYFAKDIKDNSCWVAAVNEVEAFMKAKQKLRTDKFTIERDDDVLDTWFSSALLPFSAYNWPEMEYKSHYPLDLIATGHDILFFWVARMVMLGLKLTGQTPFKQVLLNGIVCDANGRKMSKSVGNIVTPQQVIRGASLESLKAEVNKSYASGIVNGQELQTSLQGLQKMFPNGIEECGTDALRFTLCSHNIKSHFINFDVNECYTNKLFLNKIWQATRFTIGAANKLDFSLLEVETMNAVALGKWDTWILGRLAETLKICADSFENYNLHTATAALKQFFYANMCDVYLETTKSNINAGNVRAYTHCATLATCLSWGLQAMAPFTPFIAEELLQYLPRDVVLNLNNFYALPLEEEISEVLAICQAIRQFKSRNKISKKHEPNVYIFAQSPEIYETLTTHVNEIKALTLATAVHLGLKNEHTKPSAILNFYATAGHWCSFGIITNDSYRQTEHELRSINAMNQKKLQKLQKELEAYKTRFEDEGFRRSASDQVQMRHWKKMRELELEIRNIKTLTS